MTPVVAVDRSGEVAKPSKAKFLLEDLSDVANRFVRSPLGVPNIGEQLLVRDIAVGLLGEDVDQRERQRFAEKTATAALDDAERGYVDVRMIVASGQVCCGYVGSDGGTQGDGFL